jgi:hypothetical protein
VTKKFKVKYILIMYRPVQAEERVEIRGRAGRWLQATPENSKHTKPGKVWLTHHSPSFTAEVKNAWSYTSILPYAFIT